MQKIMEEKRRRALEEEAARKGIIRAGCLYYISKGKETLNRCTTIVVHRFRVSLPLLMVYQLMVTRICYVTDTG